MRLRYDEDVERKGEESEHERDANIGERRKGGNWRDALWLGCAEVPEEFTRADRGYV